MGGARDFCGRKLDPIWVHFERIESGRQAKCTNRGKTFSGNVCRLKAHWRKHEMDQDSESSPPTTPLLPRKQI